MGNTDIQEHPIPDYDGLFDFVEGEFGKDFDVNDEEIDEKIKALPYEGNEWLHETFIYFILEKRTTDYYRYENHALNDKGFTDMLLSLIHI